MGNIGHSSEGIRRTVEYLRDGAIGTVRQAHAWVPAGRWNHGLRGVPEDAPPLPDGLNWNLWLGPRETRPYHPAYVPVTWRDFWTFGCGALGDFGCHDLDSIVWAFRLTEITLLGIVALRIGKQCRWDAQAMQVTNADNAEPMIRGSYRKGWEIV